MLASRVRGAFGPIAVGLVAALAACSNGTEPKSKNNCNSSSPLTLTAGQVQAALAGPCVFLSEAGEYALVPFNSSTVYSSAATVNFTGSGVSTISTPLTSITAGASPMLATVPSLSRLGSSQPLLPSFELQLRESERRVLTPLFPAARQWLANRRTGSGTGLRPSFSTVSNPWAIGDTVVLNTNTGNSLAEACSTAVNRAGRVVAISNHAIVVADTANPTGGYTDTEYQSIAVQFDSVFTMDSTAFGAPTDIDQNGHIVMFFTRAVNELTPPHASSVVGGFFYARDLFPKQDSPQLGVGSGCPTSNFAEMFYLLVPDPNGVVNGNHFAKVAVSHLTVSTTAHEFQHLINGSRRLYINTSATDFEVVWLNEGLSHIAEELLFYQQSDGLHPRLDIDSTRFATDQKNFDALVNDQQANFGRLEEYLSRPSTTSPYAPDDSLWTRGATWSFLRYAADHRGSSDGDTWQRLVNSTHTGLQNLTDVFGASLMTMFRDWAIANIADDVSSDAEFQHPSWNFRSDWEFIFNHEATPQPPRYPLATVTVGDGSPLAVTLKGGSAAYVRFTVPAGQVGSVTWGTLPSTVSMSLVRLN
jgi:hypothetical protein